MVASDHVEQSDGKKRLFIELTELGADVDAFRKADLTEKELAMLVSGLRRIADREKKRKKNDIVAQ